MTEGMDILWPKIAGLLLIPPGLVIVIAVLGFLLHIKWAWAGIIFFAISTTLLLVFSLPQTGAQLLADLESYSNPLGPLDIPPEQKKTSAILVLGGGRYADAPEYGADTVSGLTLERLRYAVHLQQQTGLHIMISAGSVFGETRTEAELMQSVLQTLFNTRAEWLETQSRTTLENAINSREILAAAGITHVYLVTHAWHMRRAAWAFKRMGMDVTLAPMNFTTLTRGEREILGYLPSSKGLNMSSTALNEYLGLLWYRYSYPKTVESPLPASVNSPAPAG